MEALRRGFDLDLPSVWISSDDLLCYRSSKRSLLCERGLLLHELIELIRLLLLRVSSAKSAT